MGSSVAYGESLLAGSIERNMRDEKNRDKKMQWWQSQILALELDMPQTNRMKVVRKAWRAKDSHYRTHF